MTGENYMVLGLFALGVGLFVFLKARQIDVSPLSNTPPGDPGSQPGAGQDVNTATTGPGQ